MKVFGKGLINHNNCKYSYNGNIKTNKRRYSFDAIIDKTNINFNKNALYKINKNPDNNYYNKTSKDFKQKEINCIKMKQKLVNVIPRIFESIITKNINDEAYASSIFDFNTSIKISFQDYLIRLIKYTQVESNTLIYCLSLIDTLCSTKRIFLSYYNVHKIFFTALLISIKLNEDEIYIEKHYCLCSGMSANEIAELEMNFLNIVDYNLHINQERYELYIKAFN